MEAGPVRHVAIAIAALLLAGACSPLELPRRTASHGPSASPASSSPVDDVLARRGRAVLAGSESGFLADVDIGRVTLLAHERMVFANLHQLTFSKLRYVRVGSSAPLQVHSGAPADVVVVLEFAISGIDADTTASAYRYTFENRGGRVVITGVRSTSWNNMRTTPWDDVPLTVTRAADVLLVADSSVPNAASFGAAAKSAEDNVRQLWGGRQVIPGFLVLMTGSGTNFASWFGRTEFGDPLGVELPLQGVDDAGVPVTTFVGSRIVLNMGATDPSNVERVLRHEFAHAAGVRVQQRLAPAWAEEGFARWVEVGGDDNMQNGELHVVSEAVAAGHFNGQLPYDSIFYSGDVTYNYALAYTVYRFVEQKAGAQKAVEFFAQVIASTLLGSGTATIGMTEPVFLQQWANYVRGIRA
jgi:hypothetical protein